MPRRTDRALGSYPVTRSLRLGAAIALVATVYGASLAYGSSTQLDEAALVGRAALRLDVPVAPPAPSAAEVAAHEVVAVVNTQRAQRGLAAYEWNNQVEAAAAEHSADMAAHQLMQHTGTDGTNAGQRLTRAGFQWTTWGENIAAGFVDPGALVTAWLNSSSHRPQILGSYRYVGVSAVASSDGTLYWTLVVAN